jgi:hypothetical protein
MLIFHTLLVSVLRNLDTKLCEKFANKSEIRFTSGAVDGFGYWVLGFGGSSDPFLDAAVIPRSNK